MSASALAQSNGRPVIVFLKQHDSHPFTDRTIVFNGEIKVGRAVGKLRSAPNNAIFDCKVLSRSHAIIYYHDQTGKFFLRDTNSSNGTFVNNERISKDNPDAVNAERHIFSGDFVRFGVEVLENGTNHGCIITQIKLYHPNGAEALLKENQEFNLETTIYSNEQLFQLISHLNESIYREKTVHKKLDDMRLLLDETRDMSKKSWNAMLNEETLLEKLALYETKLRVLSTDLPEESIRSSLVQASEERSEFEQKSKKILEHRLEEKMEALLKVTELERCLSDSEREVKHLRQSLDLSQDAYQSVMSTLEQKQKELDSLAKKLSDASDHNGDLQSRLQSTTDQYLALRESVDSHNVVTEKDKKVDEVQNAVAMLELAQLDQFLDMHEKLNENERCLQKILDDVKDKISNNLFASAKNLAESHNFTSKLVKSLHDLATVIDADRSSMIPQSSSDETEVSSSAIAVINESSTVKSSMNELSVLLRQLSQSQTQAQSCLIEFLNEQQHQEKQQKTDDSPIVISSSSNGNKDGDSPLVDGTNDELARLHDALSAEKSLVTELREKLTSRENTMELTRDYEQLRAKMLMIEEDLTQNKTDFMRTLEEAQHLRQKLSSVESERNQLRTQLDSAQSLTPQHQPPTFRMNNMTAAMIVLPIMALLLAIMLSIFNQFAR